MRGHLVIDSNGNYFASYNLDDPKKGFFMDLFFFSNSIKLDLAFVDGDSQFCYDGIYNQGYNEIMPLYPQTFEPDQIGEALSTSSNPFTNNPLSHNQNANIIIYNQKFLENSEDNPGTRGFSDIDYGVSHEVNDFPIDYALELPDDYWEPYTTIDIGIYRFEPTEAQVKSDLQYYNRNYYDGGSNWIWKDILAYNIVAHGGPQWDFYAWVQVWFWWEWRIIATIYPNEIESLWYDSYNPSTGEEVDVYPYDTIVFADSCFSYYNPDVGTNPTMAKAFVDVDNDNGAAAFVGSTIEHTGFSDPFMEIFWYDMCQGNYNVRNAVIDFTDFWGHNWTLGVEWRIYGDQYSTLP